mmetsp:Transcript_5462/g.11243  ORF Transcript_5462/g.11243 Transcript_5462/m.11243 type:complete len:156 (-) Transcript_5462:75-542(-)
MSQYVLTGLSEEARLEARRKAALTKREKLLEKLDKVHEKLEEASEKRKVRVTQQVHQARNELDRVKLRLSDDPYKNAKRYGGGNAKNKSRLKNFVFQHPEEPEPAASTTKRTFQAISKDIHPEILNSELSFRRNHGDFTSYLEAQIRLEGLNVTK